MNAKRWMLTLGAAAATLCWGAARIAGQAPATGKQAPARGKKGAAETPAALAAPVDDDLVIQVMVDMVQMNVAVTDAKGNYVNGLGPEAFQIFEDNIPQETAIFEEGNQSQRVLIQHAPAPRSEEAEGKVEDRLASAAKAGAPEGKEPAAGNPAGSGALDLSRMPAAPAAEAVAEPQGSNVFILFDTSDYMFKDFASAQDSMEDFARSLDPLDRVAFFSYSRNLSRKVPLTEDRSEVLRGVHSVAVGDEDALFNSMNLALAEASRVQGKKMLVVFSHGPDTASTVTPEAVSELAESAGVPIYMVSTGKAQLDPLSRMIFQRISGSTGGQAYFAATRKEEQQAFSEIREDLQHLYTLSYYPKFNANRGWRTITVKLTGKVGRVWTVRTRDGYRPLPAETVEAGAALPEQ